MNKYTYRKYNDKCIDRYMIEDEIDKWINYRIENWRRMNEWKNRHIMHGTESEVC